MKPVAFMALSLGVVLATLLGAGWVQYRSVLLRLPVVPEQEIDIPIAGKVILHCSRELLTITRWREYAQLFQATYELVDTEGRPVAARRVWKRSAPWHWHAMRKFIVPAAGRYRLRVVGLTGLDTQPYELVLTKPYGLRMTVITTLFPLTVCAIFLIALVTRTPVHVPPQYIGEWDAPGARLVLSDTRLIYRSTWTSVDMPWSEFADDHFTAGVLFLKETHTIQKPPALIDGQWRMVVDGIEFSRR